MSLESIAGEQGYFKGDSACVASGSARGKARRRGSSLLRSHWLALASLSLVLLPSVAEAQYAVQMLHPIAEEKVQEEFDDVKWFKENWNLDDESGWIVFYKDMRTILAEPEEEPPKDEESSNSLCWPDPERDLKWKYCGFYTGL